MMIGDAGTTIRTAGMTNRDARTTIGGAEMTIGLPRKSRRNVTSLR